MGARDALLGSSLLAVGLLAVGCGDSRTSAAAGGVDGPPPTFGPGGDDTPFLEKNPTARFENAFRGTCLVELLYDPQSPVTYREEVGSDGNGKFSVEVLEVLFSHPDPELFKALQYARRVFSYRFRDFRIKDYQAFLQNYRTVIVDDDTSVAGVPCVQVEVERVVDTFARYRVDVDPETGLVLRWQESDPVSGEVRARVTFETFQLDADVSDMELVSRLFDTETYDRTVDDLEQAMGFEVRFPGFLPGSHFVVQDEVEKLVDELGETWAKIYVTDGLETIVLMHTAPAVSVDRVTAVRFGSWGALQSDYLDHMVLCAGKATEDDLALVLQSAFSR